MKKIVLLVLAFVIVSGAFAQTDAKKANLVDRASDHLMVELSTDHWANTPDSIKNYQSGFSRGLSIYFMIDKRFKTNPKYSIAFGLGIGNSNIFFKPMHYIGIEATSSTLQFQGTSTADPSATYYKRYKISTSYLEVPVELRYTAHPERENKSFKLALGVKAGVILDAHTKAKDLLNQTGGVIDDYVQKEASTRFFSGGRVCATARVGYGNFSIFSNYQLTSLLVPGAGPNIIFYQVGLCISGL